MELGDYLPMFLAEGREHLQTLNLSLVRIEQDPRDVETINDIFRVAHTLKGMSATMGFARMASLTHEMENVMEGMKSRSDGLSREALDTLFGCLDTLSSLVDEIEESGGEQSDPGNLVGQLQRLLATGVAAPGDEFGAGRAPAGPAADIVAAVEAAGLYVAAVTVILADDVDMPGVRAFLAVRKAEEHGELVQCEPDVAVIEAGEIASRGDPPLAGDLVGAGCDRRRPARATRASAGATVTRHEAASPPRGAAPAPAEAAVPAAPAARRRGAEAPRPRPSASRPSGSIC